MNKIDVDKLKTVLVNLSKLSNMANNANNEVVKKPRIINQLQQ